MGTRIGIYTDRQYSEAKSQLAVLEAGLQGGAVVEDIRAGLPPELLPLFRGAYEREKAELLGAVAAYERAKGGDCEEMYSRVGRELGERLIATRVCRGLSQKELARRLGVKEQAVQRWEADSYRSITLANFQNVAGVLGLNLQVVEQSATRRAWSPSFDTPQAVANRVLRHARSRKWLDGAADERELIKRIGDHVVRHGTPSLLRTGLRGVKEREGIDDWALLAWKAQVSWLAERRMKDLGSKFRPFNAAWLPELVRLSRAENGPQEAQKFLEDVGIVLVVEPQIAGMKIDGAAFLLDETPVVGMTLRKDSVDNFWFTLLHELGHAILHFRAGLGAGFFDDFDDDSLDEVEKEADYFASNMLIPEGVWSRSPARIAKDPKIIEAFAANIGIASEIIFGRIQRERSDYRVFDKYIGRGTVRKAFPEYEAA